MMEWILRIFRRPQQEEPTQEARDIIGIARDMRGSMLQETKASRHVQRELRQERERNWYEDELLQRLPRAGRNGNARFD